MKHLRLQWAKHQQRWFGKWHLYLGIVAGAIVAFVGVTGSILVFQDEIDRALNPELFLVMEQQHRMSIPEVVPVIKNKYPDIRFDYLLMDVEDKPNRAYRLFNFNTEDEFFINPYTGGLSGKRIHESSFIHIVTELHRTLLIPVAGRYIVGLSSLCLLILTISGLRLWIPQKWNQLKAMLTVKFSAGFKRQNYDWHNVLGFYSSPVVALLSLTGFCITFSPLVIALLFILNGQNPQGVAALLGAQSTYTAGAKTLSLDEVVSITGETMPGARIAGLAFPVDSTGNYRLDLVGQGAPKSGKREMLILDQYSGRVLLNSRTDFPPSGNAYLSWLTPIHYGSFGGRPTQVLALIGGLMPLALFVTGFIIWWPRYRKQNGKPKERIRILIHTGIRSRMQYFFTMFKKGCRYALYCLAVTLLMGVLYGLASGLVIEPAVFAVSFTALLVVMNFLVALPVWGVHFFFLAPFRKGSRKIVRYFALSLSFLLVFLVSYLLLMNTGMGIF
ncbi:PepSY-associated TM helix domain-containing protein [Chitinophaga barathri]|uniref:PepSY domain-containing protein n=1 Tax=Chitinophaga barathri TaxID=1647451 RepID=A0A3N4M5S9_9BACT|nr:PepSY-associated TM helix domain-containing protein [Chitinophaga barathri]RPD38664.1 PepSY domain-containing protein [Chitinophaga barathri]